MESRTCNQQSCETVCLLEPWPKSYTVNCSKPCGGGKKILTRAIKVKGDPVPCPAADSAERYQEIDCNDHTCVPTQGSTLLCASKVDVIILLDGSGSLGASGWDQMKGIGKDLVDAFTSENTQVGILVFSGPQTYGDFHKCQAMEWNSDWGDKQAICGMTWLQHLAFSEASDTKQLIQNAEWPAESTNTAGALSAAGTDLHLYSRPHTRKVVIVVTDGEPMNPSDTYAASRELKEWARLVMVTVGPAATTTAVDFADWVSKPVSSNLISVPTLNDLMSPTVVNEIVADACEEVL